MRGDRQAANQWSASLKSKVFGFHQQVHLTQISKEFLFYFVQHLLLLLQTTPHPRRWNDMVSSRTTLKATQPKSNRETLTARSVH